ncbi:MAG: aromatic amino acid hydroxylase, partial [Flavobacteriales bacterium]|nr:aromatic amino acid hydroxylase [Flavobacteriales bacterium]
ISSQYDHAVYKAIRHLSIIKEDRTSSKKDIETAEMELESILAETNEVSEMAQLRNLHWWTVEYGLFGNVNDPKIYGAGLLSSIGESSSCLEEDVKKIPYSLEAANCSFDITTRQPQLFVTPSFSHLLAVLNEFAESMALRTGGVSGIEKAIDSKYTATCVYNTGLQISGTFTDCIIDESGQAAYLRTSGPTVLCMHNEVLTGHGTHQHNDGYGSPIGVITNVKGDIASLSIDELILQGIETSKNITLHYDSGIEVSGLLRVIRKNNQGKNILFTFQDCTVLHKDQVLFDPTLGTYDLAIGTEIVSVFSGPADKRAFGKQSLVAKEKTPLPTYDEQTRELHALYGTVRKVRDGELATAELADVVDKAMNDFPKETLILLEIYEILAGTKKYTDF